MCHAAFRCEEALSILSAHACRCARRAADPSVIGRLLAGVIIPIVGFLTLMALVAALVLLMGCANIGGLLLARAAARRK